jgi:uncharacterized protein
MSEPRDREADESAAAQGSKPAGLPKLSAGQLSEIEVARGDLLLVRIIDFAHFLWELGLDVGPGRVVELVESLPLIDVGNRQEFYNFLKISLVTKREHEAIFDMAFAYFWHSANASLTGEALEKELQEQRRRALALPASRRLEAEREMARMPGRPTPQQKHPASRLREAARKLRRDDDDDETERPGTYSYEEFLRRRDFEDFSWDELREARELMARTRWRLGERQTRRRRPARHGRHLDVRGTLRRSLRSGGEPITLARREWRRKPRPLVILCDISGSMSLYSRLLLHFVHTVSSGLENVETFVFGTRLTRITRQLARKDVDEAIYQVTKSVQDWSGGTRIGESLHTFNRLWARRVLGHGAVVLIISDGWDRGDVRVLGEEMARLQRNCHRLLWLNPLLGHDEYRPVTAGMRAALPYIDDFLPANNLDSLFALGRALESIDDQRPMRQRRTPDDAAKSATTGRAAASRANLA